MLLLLMLTTTPHKPQPLALISTKMFSRAAAAFKRVAVVPPMKVCLGGGRNRGAADS